MSEDAISGPAHLIEPYHVRRARHAAARKTTLARERAKLVDTDMVNAR